MPSLSGIFFKPMTRKIWRTGLKPWTTPAKSLYPKLGACPWQPKSSKAYPFLRPQRRSRRWPTRQRSSEGWWYRRQSTRMVGMGRKGVSQGPTPFFEGPRVTSPRQAAVFPLGPPSLRAATAWSKGMCGRAGNVASLHSMTLLSATLSVNRTENHCVLYFSRMFWRPMNVWSSLVIS